jgi:hypothetical protein
MATNDRSSAIPATLPGCSVLPPMEPAGERGGAKGKAEGGKTGNTDAPGRHAGQRQRFAVLNVVTDFCLAPLTVAEVKVWLVLFRDTKAMTGTARVGQADIARRTGLNVRSVRRGVKGLKAKGLLVEIRRGRLNGGPSTYRLTAGNTTIK